MKSVFPPELNAKENKMRMVRGVALRVVVGGIVFVVCFSLASLFAEARAGVLAYHKHTGNNIRIVRGGGTSCGRLWCCSCRVFVCVFLFSDIVCGGTSRRPHPP